MNFEKLKQFKTPESRVNAVEASLRCNGRKVPTKEIINFLALDLSKTSNHGGQYDTLCGWIRAQEAQETIDKATEARKAKNVLPSVEDQAKVVGWRSFKQSVPIREVVFVDNL